MLYIHKSFIIYQVLFLSKSSQLGRMCRQMCRRLQIYLMSMNSGKKLPGCPTANFYLRSRGQPHLSDVNLCILILI